MYALCKIIEDSTNGSNMLIHKSCKSIVSPSLVLLNPHPCQNSAHELLVLESSGLRLFAIIAVDRGEILKCPAMKRLSQSTSREGR